MPQVTFVTSAGEKTVTASVSDTLMEAALQNRIDGIGGDCGGVCSCATCHVRISQHWIERVGPPNDAERDMLNFYSNATAQSRLSCQISLSEELDGLVVEVSPLD